MYCQNCGKEIEERTEICPLCNKVVNNVFVPGLYSAEKEKEKTEFSIKAIKPEKEMKRPSLIPIRITSIIMYSVLFAYYLASLINDFVNNHPYGYKTVLDGVFTVMFLCMLIFSVLGRINKRLTLIALASYSIFEIAYNSYMCALNVIFLASNQSVIEYWYILAALVLRVLIVLSMIVMLVFAFIFYLKEKFSPLPMCITSGIFLIFEVLALVYNILVMAMGISPIDVFILTSLFAVYTYFGITIAQVFLFYKQDKYNTWLKKNQT